MYALGGVGLLHVFIAYALVTGLAVDIVKKIQEPIKTIDIKDTPPPPDEPPPPPPKLDEIPPYVPPPDVQVQSTVAPPVIQRQTVVANVVPRAPTPTPTVITPPPPPAPPAAKGETRGVSPARKLQQVFGDPENYPDASIRNNEQGSTGFTVQVDEQGSVVPGSCQVTASSGFDRLDKAACTVLERKGRKVFNFALNNGTPIKSTFSGRYTWRVPK